MKLLKTTVATVALAALLAGSLSSNAQSTNAAGGRQGARGGIEAQMTRYSEELKLTDAQKPKFKAILEEQTKQRQDLRGTTDQAERRTKMKTLQEDTNKKMKELLTADQFTKYEEFVKTQRNRRQGAGANTSADQSGTAPKPKKNANK